MKLLSNNNIRVVFAGRGIDVPLIEDAASEDDRISYLGMLTMEELFRIYEESDVLMNLRIEEEVDFHFPSKLLEILTTGKSVISTPIAHAKRDYGKFLYVLDEITPMALAKLMQRIANTPKNQRLAKGIAQRKFMIENRNWNVRTDEILKYINK